MAGPIQLSRVCGPGLDLPYSQGYVGTGGDSFRPNPRVYVVPGPGINRAPMPPGNGPQWAPGQGGDTPGGGGQVLGQLSAVQTLWITEGIVTPQALQHKPGTIGFTGSRRGGA